MQTIYPYQMRLVISALTKAGDLFDDAGVPAWHTLASAAACLERLLQGEQPADIAFVSARLKGIGITEPGPHHRGQAVYAAVQLAQLIIDGHRLGLLTIQRESLCYESQPVWIGIDLATGNDQTFRSTRHAH